MRTSPDILDEVFPEVQNLRTAETNRLRRFNPHDTVNRTRCSTVLAITNLNLDGALFWELQLRLRINLGTSVSTTREFEKFELNF